MTSGEVAKRIGCSPSFIRAQIRAGNLKATTFWSGRADKRKEYVIHRDALIRWLISGDWPAEKIRQMFPLPGPLFVVSERREVVKCLGGETKKQFGSLFEAALAMHGEKPWGLLVDLVYLGMGLTCVSMSKFYKTIDRPVLIAIHGDDGLFAGAFDFAIPDSLPQGMIAQRIRALRPWRG